jgi:hypothetical protein
MALAAGLVAHATGPPSPPKIKDSPKPLARPTVGSHTLNPGAEKVAYAEDKHAGGFTPVGEKTVASSAPAPPPSQRLNASP